mmetsp:Transcript_6219/g.15859  ORF Transcript_6219/g.15859 Transcript_6219/m.15859 type:complete len:241 (+) Transcript_6219:2172-2894(+)
MERRGGAGRLPRALRGGGGHRERVPLQGPGRPRGQRHPGRRRVHPQGAAAAQGVRRHHAAGRRAGGGGAHGAQGDPPGDPPGPPAHDGAGHGAGQDRRPQGGAPRAEQHLLPQLRQGDRRPWRAGRAAQAQHRGHPLAAQPGAAGHAPRDQPGGGAGRAQGVLRHRGGRVHAAASRGSSRCAGQGGRRRPPHQRPHQRRRRRRQGRHRRVNEKRERPALSSCAQFSAGEKHKDSIQDSRK